MPAFSTTTPRDIAIIYLGAASLSMVIGECQADGTVASPEYLDKPLPVARDIFRTGAVSRATMEQAAAILRDYMKTVREFGLPLSSVRLYSTNILSEAASPEIFLNRLQVTTGCEVHLFDEGDMTRLVYLAALRLLKRHPSLAEGPTLVTHIGPGNTRALFFRKGRIAAYASYRLGIFRAREAIAALDEVGNAQQLIHIEENIKGVVDHLAQDFARLAVHHHVAIGAEIQSVAPHIVEPSEGACCLAESALADYTEKLARLSPDEMVRSLSLHYIGGEGILPALKTNLAVARRFADEVLWVPATDFQRDLLTDMMAEGSSAENFQEDVITSAIEVAKKFKIDLPHARHVMGFAQQLFRELKHLHGLGPRHELLLRVAATLHEVGMFVSAREHHKHSMYLIMNTELFGISTADRTLVALLARYHRRYNPEHNHPHFAELDRADRMIVFKLAAILRIADALDRTHSQRIKSIHLRPSSGRLHIITPGIADTTVEQLAIAGKCDLFREIFGLEVVLSRE